MIVEALFKFLKRARTSGSNEQLWQENKRIDELSFKFKEKEDPATYARFIIRPFQNNFTKMQQINFYLLLTLNTVNRRFNSPKVKIYKKLLDEIQVPGQIFAE